MPFVYVHFASFSERCSLNDGRALLTQTQEHRSLKDGRLVARPRSKEKTVAEATTRQQASDRTAAAILAAAREEVSERGGVGLSMRAVARKVGLVSSAVYRHFPSRDALLTAMIIESYQDLDQALGAVEPTAGAAGWHELAHAFRVWARHRPAEFQLIYGTPIHGFAAPAETIPAAAAVARHFIDIGAHQPVTAFAAPALTDQLRLASSQIPNTDPAGLAAVMAELAALVGFVNLELAGHFVGTADPADPLYEALINRGVDTLGLTP